MPFIFTGFRQIAGVRVFAFEKIAKDAPPANLTVAADIDLGRKHGIHLQDWPLLCIEMLEQRAGDIRPGTYDLIFAEARMRELEDVRAAARLAAVSKRKRTDKLDAIALSALVATV